MSGDDAIPLDLVDPVRCQARFIGEVQRPMRRMTPVGGHALRMTLLVAHLHGWSHVDGKRPLLPCADAQAVSISVGGRRQTVKVDVTVGLTNADAVLLALQRTVTLKRLLCLRKHHANTTDFLVGKAPYLFGCGSQLWLLQNRRRTGGSTVRDAPEVVCQGVRLGTGPRH